MAIPVVALALAAAAAATVAVVASKPPPKHYKPPRPGPSGPIGDGYDPDAVRFPDDDAFVERTGKFTVTSMLNTDRFPGDPPGYVDVTLAKVATVKPGGALRVYCDVFVTDDSLQIGPQRFSAIAVTAAALAVRGNNAIPIASLRGPTEQAQRIVRDFRSQPGGLDGSEPRGEALPHDAPDPPAVALFRGADCVDTPDKPKGWQAVWESLGLSSSAAPALFNVESCNPGGRAYEPGKTYGLRLVSVGRNVMLVATVARLPLAQLLSWRAYTASNPLP